MDDQTRGESPGAGNVDDVPLKRDRKALRSSKPLPPRSAPPAPSAREPELTPVEQLFADPAPFAPSPEPHQGRPDPQAAPRFFEEPHDYDIDLTDATPEPAAVAPSERRRFGLPGGRAPERPPAIQPDLPMEPEVRADTEPATELYVPPGGFTTPGHPRLGPLVPAPAPQHRGLAALDISAIITAVLLPPVGLVTAIVALVRGKKVRGWSSDLARWAVSLSLVMTVVFAAVGGYVWATETANAEHLAAVKAEQRAHDRVVAASAPFCEVLQANPTIYSTADPDYGWPALDDPEGYNAAIAQYAAVWAQIAEVAPPGIAEETAAISERVARVVSIANALGASNRAGDLLGLHEKDDLATVESWYVEYCDATAQPADPDAETPAE